MHILHHFTSLDNRKECENYNQTTAEDSEEESEDCVDGRKRQRKKKNYSDFELGTCIYSDIYVMVIGI